MVNAKERFVVANRTASDAGIGELGRSGSAGIRYGVRGVGSGIGRSILGNVPTDFSA
jgi:hypothetical protein